ncbi:Mitochondrial glutamate carrier 1 [Taenia crassiceps]|uniref:Mitochondrial glutamate carrier 1 n=1 Tax=Taenia crassiceps TaxID=6207 RepID=A0ABR4Q3S9_9CEST
MQVSLINGGIAGIVGVSCVFPIDLVKTRLQNQQKGAIMYKNFLDCARKTYRADGFFGMYRGSGVNLLLITPEKAIKLVGNDFFRYHLKTEGAPLTPIREMIAGGGAGMCQIIVTTPMELLKIQMQDAGRTRGGAAVASANGAVVATKRLSATRLALDLVRQKGIFGLYKGVGATALRDVTFSIMYFPLFAHLDTLGPRRSDGTGTVFYWSFLAGCTASTVAAFLVTPMDVVKTRLQTLSHLKGEMQFTGIADCFYRTLQREGLRALFKGAGCRVMVMAPLFGIAQTVYYLGVAEFLLGLGKTRHLIEPGGWCILLRKLWNVVSGAPCMRILARCGGNTLVWKLCTVSCVRLCIEKWCMFPSDTICVHCVDGDLLKLWIDELTERKESLVTGGCACAVKPHLSCESVG